MKVLLISHTVLSSTGNMGKTFLGYLKEFQVDEIAQMYVHSEVPSEMNACRNYYRFTDIDAIKSIFQRGRKGSIFTQTGIQENNIASKADKGLSQKLYICGSRHLASTMTARELVWTFSSWNTKAFRNWIKEFNPDVILLASGNYAFIYNIALKASQITNKPLVVSCVDDYYMHNRNESSLLGRITYNSFMKTVRKTMSRAKRIFTICDNMARSYEKLFGIPCNVLHTGAEEKDVRLSENADNISYLGNLGFNRYKQLIKLSHALGKINGGYIDVYSSERTTEYIDALKAEPNIRFHGEISAGEVLEVMSNSKIVIHTEDFEEEMKLLTRYSVSTKIAESLMYGPCLLAYGPEGIASIDYLKEHGAAYVITDKDDLEDCLSEVLSNTQLRAEIIKNARSLAKKNHVSSVNSANVRKWLSEVCEEYADEGALC